MSNEQATAHLALHLALVPPGGGTHLAVECNSQGEVTTVLSLVLSLQRIETWGGVAGRRSLLPPSDLRSGRPLLLLPPRAWRPAVPPLYALSVPAVLVVTPLLSPP